MASIHRYFCTLQARRRCNKSLTLGVDPQIRSVAIAFYFQALRENEFAPCIWNGKVLQDFGPPALENWATRGLYCLLRARGRWTELHLPRTEVCTGIHWKAASLNKGASSRIIGLCRKLGGDFKWSDWYARLKSIHVSDHVCRRHKAVGSNVSSSTMSTWMQPSIRWSGVVSSRCGRPHTLRISQLKCLVACCVETSTQSHKRGGVISQGADSGSYTVAFHR